MRATIAAMLVAWPAVLPVLCAAEPEPAASASPASAFFAFCMDTHDSKQRTLPEQAALLKELGYDGAGHIGLDNIGERLATLDAAGLRLFQVYLHVSIAPDQPPYDPRLTEVLPLLKGRGTMLALLMGGLPPSDPAGDIRAVEIVREIAGVAAASAVRVVLYPHAGDWLERVTDAVRVARKADRPNVGVMFNLCHWLKVDDEESLKPLLVSAMPYLFAVSINGADRAAEIHAGTGNWIQPLDSGAFDVRAFLNTLSDLGYRGPIGLQCWGLGGDARGHLTRSMAAWRKMTGSPPSAGPELDATVPAGLVAPIDWTRFKDARELDADCVQCGDLLRNCATYVLQWIPKTFAENSPERMYVLTRMEERGIRPASSSVYALAALIATRAFDAAAIGMSQDEALERTVKLLRGAAATHKVHRGAEGWGDCWQSALWAAQLGFGGWMLWERLDPNTKELLVPVVVHEADRFIDYKVPYSNENKKNTKAEENSWNSMILNVAVAMMPRHPHVTQWKRKCSELMVSSYATEKDWRENTTVLDGTPVRQWLAGFNAFEGGIVYNHGFLHPDYMVAETMSLWAYLAQSLAGGPVPETADFNGALIYRTLVTRDFPSPPFEAPGGAIYRPGQASVYYPKGVDWSTHDLTLYYLTDVWAHVLDWDQGLPEQAVSWMRLRAPRMLEMQQRHEDRRMFAKGEYDTYEGAEQLAMWCIADAYLALWLNAHHALGPAGNWLAPGR